jgi:hypothetical protein
MIMENEKDLNADLVAALRETTKLQKDLGKEAARAVEKVFVTAREFVQVILRSTDIIPDKSSTIVQEVGEKLLDEESGLVPKTKDVINALLFVWEAQTITAQNTVPLIQRWNELWCKMIDDSLPK